MSTTAPGNDKLRIGVLHYHFLRCGVRSVIVNALRSLIAYGGYKNIEVDLISSDAAGKNGQEIAEELRQWGLSEGTGTISIRQIEIPQLGYNQKKAADTDEFLSQCNAIRDVLLDKMELGRTSKQSPYVLHVHNGNLGKNPRVTMALKLLADKLEQDDLPGWILYQMHDFAEDHRPNNWEALKDCTGKSDRDFAVEMMYPQCNRITWVSINSPDRDKIISTGIESEAVDLLANAVDTENFSAKPITRMNNDELTHMGIEPINFMADLKSRIGSYAKENNFCYEPQRRILLAPIKAIRRKNVIESILLLMMINSENDRYQLLVTLPANSEQDINYCKRIEKFVKQHHLPVVMSFGNAIMPGGHQRVIKGGRVEGYSLVDLMAISESVVTTSVQEGFGYVFHEPWLVGKAVLGRDIPSVTNDFRGQGMDLGHLYARLLVPRRLMGNMWPTMLDQYCRKAESARSICLQLFHNL